MTDDIVMRARLVDDITANLHGIAAQIGKVGKQANVRGLRDDFAGLRNVLRTVGSEFRLGFIPNLLSAGLGIGGAAIGLKGAIEGFKGLANEAKRVAEWKTMREEVGLTQQTISTFIAAMKHESVLPQQSMAGLRQFGDQMQLLRRQVANSPIWEELQRLKGGPEFRSELLFTKDDDAALKVIVKRMRELNEMGEGIAARRLANIFIGFAEAARLTEDDLVRLSGKVYLPTKEAEESARRIKRHMIDTQIQTSAWGEAFKAAMFPVAENISASLAAMTTFNADGLKEFAAAMKELGDLIPVISSNVFVPMLATLARDVRDLIAIINLIRNQPFGPSFDWLNKTPAELWSGNKPASVPLPRPRPSALDHTDFSDSSRKRDAALKSLVPLGGGTLISTLKGDAETGHHLRSALREMLGLPDPMEPAPWQPGGAWDRSLRDTERSLKDIKKPLESVTEEFQELHGHLEFSGSRRDIMMGGIGPAGGGGASPMGRIGGGGADAGPYTDNSAGGVIDRSRFAEELQQKPWLRQKLLGIMAGENMDPRANISVAESAMNRAAMLKTSLEREARLTGEGGYYAGYKPGALRNPKTAEFLNKNLDTVLAGSNVSNYATDNASGGLALRNIATGRFIKQSEFGGETFFSPGTARIGRRNIDEYRKWRALVAREQAGQGVAKRSSFWGGYDPETINRSLGIRGGGRTPVGTANVNVFGPPGTRANYDTEGNLFRSSGLNVVKTPENVGIRE